MAEGARLLAIGVDVGGTGIKAALVDVKTGELVGERIRVLTPMPSKPRPVVASAGRGGGGLGVRRGAPDAIQAGSGRGLGGGGGRPADPGGHRSSRGGRSAGAEDPGD